MKTVLKAVGIGCGGICVMIVLALAWVGHTSPDTAVYPGRQVPARFVERVKALGLLAPGESILYFYSDAIFDIEDGMYFVTDRHLVCYNREWEEPKTIIPFADITDLTVEYNDSVFEDSYVTVTTVSEMEVFFPVSSEHGRDRKFVEAIAWTPPEDGVETEPAPRTNRPTPDP